MDASPPAATKRSLATRYAALAFAVVPVNVVVFLRALDARSGAAQELFHWFTVLAVAQLGFGIAAVVSALRARRSLRGAGDAQRARDDRARGAGPRGLLLGGARLLLDAHRETVAQPVEEALAALDRYPRPTAVSGDKRVLVERADGSLLRAHGRLPDDRWAEIWDARIVETRRRVHERGSGSGRSRQPEQPKRRQTDAATADGSGGRQTDSATAHK